jgi:predicted ATP-grasp superfamily ATP-dependent carboligase
MNKLTPNYMNPDMGKLIDAINELIGEVDVLKKQVLEPLSSKVKIEPLSSKPTVKKAATVKK